MAINYNEEEFGLQLPNNNQGIMEVAKLYNTPDGHLPYWGPGQYNYNEGMLNTPSTPETLNFPADTAMAISNYEELFGPKTMTDANQSLYAGMMDQSGFPINYTDRIRQQNLPGFAYEPKESLRNIINSQLQNVKTKAGQGFDFAQEIPGMLLSAASGIPFAGQLVQGIGGLLGNIFKESPEQAAMMDLYNSAEYQDVLNQIPGMANYNPVYGMGAGYGLDRAIGKRLATINKALGRMTPQELAETSLKKRKEKLEKLLALEQAVDFARVSASGRRPTAPTGGGTQDTGAAAGFSPGQAGAGTGGYSYDSGGREGYGYGLKDGGLVSLFTRRG